MKGSENKMLSFMEGAKNRYVIPVYQRAYSWKIENCRQLYEDLKKMYRDNRRSHFFGSIVAEVVPKGSKIEYYIIDGQQRLTTVTLLLLAMRNLLHDKKIVALQESLKEQINELYLIEKWADEDDKIKLRPVKSDRVALEKLFSGDSDDYDRTSNLTINYQFFCDMLLKEELPVDDLFEMIGRLEIINITLELSDNAQLIFESLNSTGLALSEGDKIRNYILMGQSVEDQNKFFNEYWVKIEKCTGNDVSAFVRDFLSIKQQVTPNIDGVYVAFKRYVEDGKLDMQTLLGELLQYARYFERLRTSQSGLHDKRLDDCLYRMMRLEITVTRPFFMEVLKLEQDGALSVKAVRQIFEMAESYLFRRNICSVATSALNKIFLTLNKDILRYDGTASDYVNKMSYTLLSKKESGRFPNDEEFSRALSQKSVYSMRGKYRAYLFERFENQGTLETKDVYNHLDNRVYSIEHIMPQTITPAWRDALGADALAIHAEWKDRLANLTLTGYNSKLSNKSFVEKRDAQDGGYEASGLRMNQKIAQKESWGLVDLEERDAEMVAQALTIWRYPQTDFVPIDKVFDSCTLADEDFILTGRYIEKYAFQNTEHPAASWAEMFESMVRYLHEKDKSVLPQLAYSGENNELGRYVSDKETDLRQALEIDNRIYIERNTSTSMKISILRKLFVLYGEDAADLMFYLKDSEYEKEAEEHRYDLRMRYWAFALPLIQEKHLYLGTFKNVKPTTTNWVTGSFDLGGFGINCSANYENAKVSLYLGKGDAVKNKEAFDRLIIHKNDIEKQLGVPLVWDRLDDCKASTITYTLSNVGLKDESSWTRMAKFHAEWSYKFYRVMVPYLYEGTEEKLRLRERAEWLREWAVNVPGVNVNLQKSNTTVIRFTTDAMSQLLPESDIEDSGWNTANHYFYEIKNRNDQEVSIQLVVSVENAKIELLATCEKINAIYPVKAKSEQWKWRTIFRTKGIESNDGITKEIMFKGLDECLKELQAFEQDLIQKLG